MREDNLPYDDAHHIVQQI
jgi:hypothetical protein